MSGLVFGFSQGLSFVYFVEVDADGVYIGGFYGRQREEVMFLVFSEDYSFIVVEEFFDLAGYVRVYRYQRVCGGKDIVIFDLVGGLVFRSQCVYFEIV